MYILDENTKELTENTQLTFSDIGWNESHVEDMLRKNIDIICDGDESMLIVGQQVVNESMGRNDLMALDDSGNIVLIEIKRDKKDMEARKESFEFQAIRYAASCSTIKDYSELLEKAYIPYIKKHFDEFKQDDKDDAKNIAEEKLSNFVKLNNITNFNVSQRIVLVASEFDEQTVSAVAWLVKNNLDIRCYTVKPYKINNCILLDVDKLLQVSSINDYFVQLKNPGVTSVLNPNKGHKTILPKIKDMLEWGVVKAGDQLYCLDSSENKHYAILQSDGRVELEDKTKISMQMWLKAITGWSSVQTYVYTYLEKTGETLSEIRANYMDSDAYKNSLSE